MPPRPPYGGDATPETFAPFLVGYVELEGFGRIETRLVDVDADTVRIGPDGTDRPPLLDRRRGQRALDVRLPPDRLRDAVPDVAIIGVGLHPSDVSRAFGHRDG